MYSAVIVLLLMAVRLRRARIVAERATRLLANQGLLEQKVAERTTELELAKGELETAYAQLEQSRARLSLALDGAREALWDWDITKNRTYYSQRWAEILGFTPEEVGDSTRFGSALCTLTTSPRPTKHCKTTWQASAKAIKPNIECGLRTAVGAG